VRDETRFTLTTLPVCARRDERTAWSPLCVGRREVTLTVLPLCVGRREVTLTVLRLCVGRCGVTLCAGRDDRTAVLLRCAVRFTRTVVEVGRAALCGLERVLLDRVVLGRVARARDCEPEL
jgi:hypothetical protein